MNYNLSVAKVRTLKSMVQIISSSQKLLFLYTKNDYTILTILYTHYVYKRPSEFFIPTQIEAIPELMKFTWCYLYIVNMSLFVHGLL